MVETDLLVPLPLRVLERCRGVLLNHGGLVPLDSIFVAKLVQWEEEFFAFLLASPVTWGHHAIGLVTLGGLRRFVVHALGEEGGLMEHASDASCALVVFVAALFYLLGGMWSLCHFSGTLWLSCFARWLFVLLFAHFLPV